MRDICFLLAIAVTIYALTIAERNEKLVGLLNYVTFPNDVCYGDGSLKGNAGRLSGNCYTKQECDKLGGTAAGECADGYGVCCVFRPACGETIKQNLSYLIQAETQEPGPKFCSYTICPVDSGVNRIRLQFTSFVIGGPVTLQTGQAATVDAVDGDATGSTTRQGSVGDCIDDTFVVTGTKKGSPVICGTNTGQHMVVDTDGEKCVVASFVLGVQYITREYEIRVLQYDKQNELGGPSGCLQYFIDDKETVTTFNWGSGIPRTHLSNQNYEVCIRRNRKKCGICWAQVPHQTYPAGASPAIAGTFGLSISHHSAIAQSRVDADCTNDYIVIPNGVAPPTTNANDPLGNDVTIGKTKFCGRFLNPGDSGQDVPATVCSLVTPFKLTVVTDDTEILTGRVGMGDDVGDLNEASAVYAIADAPPLGTMGFSLTYDQRACP